MRGDDDWCELPSRDGFRKMIRPWQPGDGLRCTFMTRASLEIPCGKPVAAKKVVDERIPPPRARTYVVCTRHLTDAIRPCDIRSAADTAARQALIVKHWEEYQRLLQDQVRQRLADLCSGLSSEMQELVLSHANPADGERRSEDV
jgi:hypothetical protein